MSETQADTSPHLVHRLSLCFTTRIHLTGGRRFLLDPEGEVAQIATLRDRFGLIEDLIAWFPDAPGRWYAREGLSPILGARELALAVGWPEPPIPIYPTPATWVEAGGNGICILDWGVELLGCFEGIAEIGTAHLPAATAKAIEKRLEQNFWRGLPRIGGRHGG